ncbi:MAG TPA: leucyl/phenylalanyl-tRNA--protein transferase [Rhizomicrobium sp.]|jgi:leucyl/phenylalanyl-tRNA--protein transferase|nr:leucyl/phenylalanyl-tRNA--protein transferase [Rhizomicrobium sp.]
MHGRPHLTPEILLRAYAEGVFPMAERRDSTELYWVSPEQRGVIPLDKFHVPRRLARTVRSDRFRVTSDLAFVDVMRACAEPAPDRDQSWINAEILRLYTALHASGHAHSIECWQDDLLVGGLYGVSLGAAFFGESMFNRARDASKVALVHLVASLISGGFELLDAQFITSHLAQFGTIEIPRSDYLARLDRALAHKAYWSAPSGKGATASLSEASGDFTFTGARDAITGAAVPGALVLQKITQTS